jgi:hypothetical protein
MFVCLADAMKKRSPGVGSDTKRSAEGDSEDVEEGEIIPEKKKAKQAFSYF